MVECTGLENRRTLIASPGFESLVSRQDLHESPADAGLLRLWGLRRKRRFLAGVPKLCLFGRFRGRPDPPVNPLCDLLFAVSQQQACIADIDDFRGRLRPYVAELKPSNLGRERRIALFDGVLLSFFPRLVPAQAQHKVSLPRWAAEGSPPFSGRLIEKGFGISTSRLRDMPLRCAAANPGALQGR